MNAARKGRAAVVPLIAARELDSGNGSGAGHEAPTGKAGGESVPFPRSPVSAYVRGERHAGDHQTAPAGLPAEFTSAAQAMADGADEWEVIGSVARTYADIGEGIPRFLDDLESAYRALGRRRPGRRLIRHASEAWGDEIMSLVRDLTCADPLTGLASLSHLRLRVAELHRSESAARRLHLEGEPWALVIVATRNGSPLNPTPIGQALRPQLHLASLGQAIRTVIPRLETAAAVNPHTLVGLVGDSAYAVRRLVEMADALARSMAQSDSAIVRVEPRPATLRQTDRLLDELTALSSLADPVAAVDACSVLHGPSIHLPARTAGEPEETE